MNVGMYVGFLGFFCLFFYADNSSVKQTNGNECWNSGKVN